MATGSDIGGQAQSGGGAAGGVWGALIGGIFDSVGKQQDLQNQTAAFQQAQHFREGNYKMQQDWVILIIFLVLLFGILFFTKK